MTGHHIKTIDVHELKMQLDSTPNLCLIDVREPHEWQAIRIPGAVLIPKDQIAEKIGEVMPDKTKAIYLHCKAGARSLYAAQCLINEGYEEVYSVNGGILEWASAGYPVVE